MKLINNTKTENKTETGIIVQQTKIDGCWQMKSAVSDKIKQDPNYDIPLSRLETNYPNL
jgi:hypothetical protein